jgi:arylformamidase
MSVEPRPKNHPFDRSHSVEHGLVTCTSLPGPIICDDLSRKGSQKHCAPGTEFQIGKIEMVANTGTYADAPFHRFVSGKELSELRLSSLAELDTVVVRPTIGRERAIDARARSHSDLRGKAVLIHTGRSQHWATVQYFERHPFLTEDAAQPLRDAGRFSWASTLSNY